ncbi:Tim44/TimA family putative adaptor protein [Aestuariivirga sp.]|jgi:predicted lipid-binding transport protein (Tim44 family)|uniref:Tim44/TimA family putative adaptor protein n=1 Tax=Aestuariivirga sp. TaxID=2650926 RepID=UPI003782D7E8
MTIDPLNILLLAIALVVFWRLRSVLGARTGTEKPPLRPFEPRSSDRDESQDAESTVVDFPQTNGGPGRDQTPGETAKVWTGFAEPDSQLAISLEAIASRDPSFAPASFLEGAKLAYEMTVEAFAKGDTPTLKTLLSKSVFDDFSRVISKREADGQKVETNFVGIDRAKIQAARLEGKTASITVEFVSELITATYDKGGQLIDGDPRQIGRVTDVWTFERDLTSRNPNWSLVSTQVSE